MSFWTRGAQANEMARFSATHTLSDFPLLIGEILRRGDLRSRRQARRRSLFKKIKGWFCWWKFSQTANRFQLQRSKIEVLEDIGNLCAIRPNLGRYLAKTLEVMPTLEKLMTRALRV